MPEHAVDDLEVADEASEAAAPTSAAEDEWETGEMAAVLGLAGAPPAQGTQLVDSESGEAVGTVAASARRARAK